MTEKNTIYNLKLADLEAFKQALKDMDHVSYTIVHLDDVHTPAFIEVTVERYAMDGNGYHVGWEEYVGEMVVLDREALGICGPPPYGMSKYVVVPGSLTVTEVRPACEVREYTEQDAREFLLEYTDFREPFPTEDVLGLAYDHGLGEGDYCPPDDDFAYQELSHYVEWAIHNLPEAEFHRDERHWTMGDMVWGVG